jgi:hypothetical protein
VDFQLRQRLRLPSVEVPVNPRHMTRALRFFLLLWLSAFFAGARVSRTYDAAGNRLTRTSMLGALIPNASHAYDANNRLQSDRYDANGNLTNRVDFNGRTTAFLYDVLPI